VSNDPAESATSPSSAFLSRADYLTQLAAAARTLNEQSDLFTQQMAEVESAINKLNLGIPASVTVEEVKTNDFATHFLDLEYGKLDGRWCLIVTDYDDEVTSSEYSNCKQWAYRDAPRELRLKVVQRLPQLLEQLLKSATAAVSEISKGAAIAKELAVNLSEAGLSQGKADAATRRSK
jgi:uncharacterized phage infection (PIP) family protein YhgE